MRVIAFLQVYNEEMFVEHAIMNRLQYVDEIIITEGRLTPFGNLPMRSTDSTRNIVERLSKDYDKIVLLDSLPESAFNNCINREACEGINKNYMLSNSSIQNNDVIHILDCDEFYTNSGINFIIDTFKNNDPLLNVLVMEYQFAYNLKHYFDSGHTGRWMRFKNGSKFKDTNHFFVNGSDVSADRSIVIERENSGVYHLCWVKPPELIREKVISFNRLRFTIWFNRVYLVWPLNSQQAYLNNRMTTGGSGFCEGQPHLLKSLDWNLPEEIKTLSHLNYWDDIIENHKMYKI